MESPTVNCFMENTIPEWAGFSKDVQDYFAILLIGYITKQWNFNHLRKEAKAYIKPKDIVLLRSRLVNTFDINLGLKMVIIKALHSRNPKTVFKIARMQPGDESLIDLIHDFKLAKPIIDVSSNLPEKMAWPRDIQKHCGEDIERISPMINNLVSKKLRFLVKSFNESLNNFVMELKTKGIQVYYHIAPFYHGLHRLNFVIHSIYTECGRIIYYHRRKKRDRYDIEGQVSVSSYSENEYNGSSIMAEESIMLKSYLSHLDSRQRQVVNLMLFNNEPNFIECSGIKVKTPVQLANKIGIDAYIEYVSKFCGRYKPISVNEVNTIIQDLKSMNILQIMGYSDTVTAIA